MTWRRRVRGSRKQRGVPFQLKPTRVRTIKNRERLEYQIGREIKKHGQRLLEEFKGGKKRMKRTTSGRYLFDDKEIALLDNERNGRIKVFYEDEKDIDLAIGLAEAGILTKVNDVLYRFKEYKITREGAQALKQYYGSKTSKQSSLVQDYGFPKVQTKMTLPKESAKEDVDSSEDVWAKQEHQKEQMKRAAEKLLTESKKE